jgi:type II secretion system protein I
MNRMEELRAERTWPGTGTRSGSEELGDRIWEWTQQVERTADPNVRRVNIEVALDDEPDAVLAVVTGYLGQPSATPGLR